jgi:glycosyltransferase involved in cell wall biosynthesis
MKVLLVITGLGMGGAEHVVVNLADALVERGHQVKIVYLTGDALVLPQHSNVEVLSLGMESPKNVFIAYFRLRRLVRKFKPDVVHGHMFHAIILARLLRLSVFIPNLLCTAHNTHVGGKFRVLAYRITDSLTDMSTNVSQEAVEAFVTKGALKLGRMVSIVNGIDINRFSFDDDARKDLRNQLERNNKKIILAIGRLHTQKDYSSLLHAIALLAKKKQDFKVFIVGDGPLKEELVLLMNNLGVSEFVEFLGVRRDIPALMSAADLFVLSSAWEGFGLVVAEAMACERVVVATDCGGVSEVMGSDGFLVQPENSTLLAEALNKALELTKQQSNKVGEAARQRIVKNFSLDANVDTYLKLYNKT